MSKENLKGEGFLTKAKTIRVMKHILEKYDTLEAHTTRTQIGSDVFDKLQQETTAFITARLGEAIRVARKLRKASTLHGGDFAYTATDDKKRE